MKTRIRTAIIAMAIFIPIVIYGELPFTLFMYALGTVGVYELLRMKHISIASTPAILSFVMLWILLVPAQYMLSLETHGFSKMKLVCIIILLLLSYTVFSKNNFTFDDVGFLLLSAFYVGMGFYYFIQTRAEGMEYIFFTLFVIWATDSGAYFVGRAVGKNKLWPEISPNKTIEGALGGVLCAVIVAVVFQIAMPFDKSLVILIVIAVLVSVFGQLGDLVQSAFKRHYGVKDSGTLLPGHGGVLDRFDSLLFALPILHLLNLMF